MKIVLTLFSVLYATFSFSAPWGGGTVGYNPMGGGFLTNPNPSFYHPGAGNLNPSFSYTQQPSGFQFNGTGQQHISSSFISQKAKKVIGKWRQKVVSNQENPEKISASTGTIASDRRTLDSALRARGLTPDQTNTIGQIKLLLDLAEVRALTNAIKEASSRFPGTYSSIVSGKTDQTSSISSYTSRRNKIASLLKKFQNFLSRFPQYYQNPPELLVGLQDSLVAGQKAFEEYQQFSKCFSSPDLPYCAELAQKSPESEKRHSSDRGDEYEEDFDVDERGYDRG